MSLVSTFWYLNDERFNCHKCKLRYGFDYRDSKKACNTQRPTPIVEYKKLIKYFKCPSAFHNPSAIVIFELYNQSKNGIMPYSGGFLEQPSKVMDCFRLFDSLEAEYVKELQDKAKKWQKGQSRSNYPLKNKKP